MKRTKTTILVSLAVVFSTGVVVFANSFSKTHPKKNMEAKKNSTNMDFITFGAVHLEVTERNRSVDFWQNIIGMKLRKEEAGVVELGTDSQTLIVLYPVAKTPFQNGYSGLYHLAVHPPDEEEFARIGARLIAKGIQMSPIDHTASKAIYMTDPDGITIEITLETQERFKRYDTESGRFDLIDSAGIRKGITERLDIAAIIGKYPNIDIGQALSEKTKIGHMHLYVGNLKNAKDFYLKLGFEESLYVPQFQMADMAAGGVFRHRIAFNTWQGVDKPQAPAGTAGMRHYIIKYDTDERLQKALQQLPEAIKQEDGYLVSDPSGNKTILTIR